MLHIFQNLRAGKLLEDADKEDSEDDEVDEREENDEDNVEKSSNCDDYEFRSVRSSTEKQKKLNNARAGTVASNNNNSASVQSVAVNSPHFSVNFRDVEDSTRPFSGDEVAVEVWISDFENMVSIMYWDDLQKLIFAKRSLKGLA